MDAGCIVKSAFLTLSKNDLVRAVAMTALTVALAAVAPAVYGGALTTAIVINACKAGAYAGGAKLVQSLLTNSDGKMASESKPYQEVTK